MIGKTFSHYKISGKLGEGGMGVIYKAQDTRLKRHVVLKFLPADFNRDKRAKKRFLHEAQTASALDHTNICTIHEIDETEDGRMYIAMSYYEGETLNVKIERGPLDLEETIDIAIQVAEGLKNAHMKQIVHRDIKPPNIMLTRDGVAKILDFGLSKLVGQARLTSTDTTMGTVYYMSPEQSCGEEIDHRTDIWSLGAVLYQMITGKVPFKGEYNQSIMYSIINEEPEPITSVRSGVPMDLERIVNKTLEKSKNERYQHMDDLIVDLLKLKKGTKMGKITPYKPVKSKILKRVPKPILISGIFILIAIITIAGYFLFKGKQRIREPVTESIRRINSIAIPYFRNNSGDDNLDYLRYSLTDLMITDLAQSKFIRVLSEERLLNILTQMNKLDTTSYTLKDLKEIASRGGVKNMLVGKYTKMGEEFRINITIQNVSTGEIIGSEQIKGIGENSISSIVDKLTKRVKVRFKLSRKEIANDIDREVGQITTSSPEALKLYIEGKRYLNKRQFKESIAVLKKAIKIDPEFALAYRRIAINYNYMRDYEKEKKYIKQALNLSNRISERERYLIQGYVYSNLENSYEKAIKTYKELLQHYPNDENGNIYLGAIYRNIEEWDLAVEQFKKIIKTNPTLAYENLAYIFMAKGGYDKAIEILQANQNILTNQSYYHFFISNIFLCQGKFDFALVEGKKALTLEPDNHLFATLMGNIYHIKGDFQLAERYYNQLIKKNDPNSQLAGRFWKGHLHLTQGQFKKCMNEILNGITLSQKSGLKYYESKFLLFLAYLNLQQKKFTKALDPSNQATEIAIELRSKSDRKSALFFKGLAYLKMNKMEEAKKTAQQLKKLIEKSGYKKSMRQFYHLMGKINWEEGLKSQSIDFFEKAISLLPAQSWTPINNHAIYFDSLAVTLYNTKDVEKPQIYYEKIISLTRGRLHWGDIYVKSFYRLGKIYQHKGWNSKAIKHYEQFLNIWKNADPGIPEKTDARNQLITLKEESNKKI